MNMRRHMHTALEGIATWRGDAAYERLRLSTVWNARTPERFPEVIIRAGSEQDVVRAVSFARSADLKIAVRGSGHSWIGSPLRDGGMLIDLSQLRELSIDPAARTAALQPAVTGRESLAALEGHGLAFPTGHCPTDPGSFWSPEDGSICEIVASS